MVTQQVAPTVTAALSIDGLAVQYGEGRSAIRAVGGASLEVRTGEVVALVGPNGSGKTSLIHAVAGVIRPTSGNITVCGEDATAMGANQLARLVSVLPQEPVLPPAFKALECVLMGRTPYLRLLQSESPDDAEVARRAMVATDTWRFAERPMGELSGGERQRVVLARALAQETPVLLLDEPTAHLDIGQQATVLALVRSVARESGKAVLAVVHDLTLAGGCDRVVALRAGKVIADGAPREVITPELVAAVYGLGAHVFPHPETGDPVVAPSFPRA